MAEPSKSPDWDALAARPDFKQLLREKARFLVPCTIFFVVYYFSLPVLVGYFPEMMAKPAVGQMNWAYLFSLSQFAMAWILAFLYVRVAAGWDRKSDAILEAAGEGGSAAASDSD